MGPGILDLEETGLVVDGDLPRFRIPIVDYFYHRILAVRCTRTIPYSAILDHRPVSRWPRWIAKGFVLLVMSLFLAGFVAAMVSGSSPWKCGLGMVVVASLALVTVLAGRPVYQVAFRDPEGRKCRFHFSIKTRDFAQEFARRLAECRAAVAAVEAAGTALPEAAPGTSAGSPSQEETKDWAPSAFEPFEVRCPDCGRRRTINRPEEVGALVACKACRTSYLVRRPGQDVRELLAKQSRPPAPAARPKPDEALRFQAIGVALLHSVVWALAALLVCVVVHAAVVMTLGDAERFPDVPVIGALVSGFYYPGTQLYALFLGTPAVWGPREGASWWAIHVPVALTCLFWSGVLGFLGFFSHAARPEPPRSAGKAVVLLAKWLPVACGVLVLGWLVRDLIQLQTRATEQKLQDEAEQQRQGDAQFVPPWFARRAGDDARAKREMRRQEEAVREVKDHLATARKLEEQKKHFDAQAHYEIAVERVRATGRAQDEAMLVMLLARNLARQGKHAEAGLHYERAITLLESADAPRHPDAALVHLSYAQHLQAQGDSASARSHFDAALWQFRSAAEAVRPREVIVCYLDSAANLMALGRYGEARRHASEASALAQQHPGPDQLEMIALARSLQLEGLMELVLPTFFWGIPLAIALAIAWHAGKCGYSPLLWVATGLLSGFPMVNLAVLASLRDLRLERERGRVRRQVLGLLASSPAALHSKPAGRPPANP
jgi:tetratricopeptide (TPR) repeat protein